jgi:CPA2 family monovalent cation:H+ antiporter-2
MLPLQSIFAALFFVGMGMLFDPSILTREPLRVLAVVGIVVVGKSLAGLAIVLLLRRPLRTGLTVSAALAQIGEFSFILSGLGVALGLVSAESHSLVVAAALLSITLNPLIFSALGVGRGAGRAQRFLRW